jgi:hypothetical protein
MKKQKEAPNEHDSVPLRQFPEPPPRRPHNQPRISVTLVVRRSVMGARVDPHLFTTTFLSGTSHTIIFGSGPVVTPLLCVPLLLAPKIYHLPAVRDGVPSALSPGKTLTHDGALGRRTHTRLARTRVGFSTAVPGVNSPSHIWTTFTPPLGYIRLGTVLRKGEEDKITNGTNLRPGTVVPYVFLYCGPSRSSSATYLDSGN